MAGEAKTGPTIGETWIRKAQTMPLGEIGFGVGPVHNDNNKVEEL